MKKTHDKEDQYKVVATNRKAYHDYFIEEKFEAGVILRGTEVKSLREGRVNLQDSYASLDGDEIYLQHCHISRYSHGNLSNHDPLRKRKLLLHRKEINKLMGKTQLKGLTIVPLRIYFSKRGLAKVELALAKGKSNMTAEQPSRRVKPAAKLNGRLKKGSESQLPPPSLSRISPSPLEQTFSRLPSVEMVAHPPRSSSHVCLAMAACACGIELLTGRMCHLLGAAV